jgi:putative ABC transport system ATP-binding protein
MTMGNDKGLIVKNITKSMDGITILNNISFTVNPGQIFALLGGSGSGKTTLLKSINRLIEFDNGSIILNRQSILSLDPIELRRKAGMVLQISTMLDGTVRDNIEFGLRVRDDLKDINQRVLKSSKDAGLSIGFLKKNAMKLSGGEQQRVALARLLVLEPEVLLLDEPTAALDPKLTYRIEETIRKLCKKMDLMIIWVTHNHAQARRIGDSIGILKDGGIKVIKNSKTNSGKILNHVRGGS